MSHIHKEGPSRVKKFLTGNGFYLSLALCVIAVAGVAVATFTGRLGSQLSSQNKNTNSSQSQPADKPATGIPDDRSKTTASTAAHSSTTSSGNEKPAANTTAESVLYVLPLSNTVLKPFSNGQPAYSQTMADFRLHNGTDFSGKEGDTVMAVTDGTVTAVSTDALWGDTVEMDHGFGVKAVYRGVKATVKKGDTVKAGKAIGTLTSIPCEKADGPHLHLELTADGKLLDPVKAIGKEVHEAAPSGDVSSASLGNKSTSSSAAAPAAGTTKVSDKSSRTGAAKSTGSKADASKVGA